MYTSNRLVKKGAGASKTSFHDFAMGPSDLKNQKVRGPLKDVKGNVLFLLLLENPQSLKCSEIQEPTKKKFLAAKLSLRKCLFAGL